MRGGLKGFIGNYPCGGHPLVAGGGDCLYGGGYILRAAQSSLYARGLASVCVGGQYLSLYGGVALSFSLE